MHASLLPCFNKNRGVCCISTGLEGQPPTGLADRWGMNQSQTHRPELKGSVWGVWSSSHIWGSLHCDLEFVLPSADGRPTLPVISVVRSRREGVEANASFSALGCCCLRGRGRSVERCEADGFSLKVVQRRGTQDRCLGG